jgi:adenine deaminase
MGARLLSSKPSDELFQASEHGYKIIRQQPGNPMTDKLELLIDQGTGREPADIVLKGGKFFDLVTGELVASDIAICGDRIVGTCGDYTGKTE